MKHLKRNGRIPGWLAAVFLAAMFLSVGIMCFIWENYKNRLIGYQKMQLQLIADSISDTMELMLDRSIEDITRMSLILEETGRFEPILKRYVEDSENYVTGALLTDSSGHKLLDFASVEAAETLERSDCGEQVVLEQILDQDKNMYFVFRKTLKTGGELCLYLDSGKYWRELIADIKIGSDGYVVLKTTSGIVLMHPVKEQIGIRIIEDRRSMYNVQDLQSLEELLKRQYRGETGVMEYHSYWWDDPNLPRVKKIAAYTPVYIGDDFLVLSVVMDYSELFAPVAKGFAGMFCLLLVILGVISGSAVYLIRLNEEKRRDQEEILYLKQLNATLEEMHRSENAIAHQQRLQIMGTMTSGIAHEFNNLLTPILGYADLLREEFDEESDEYDSVNEILLAAEKAKEVIQQLSSLSRKNMETVFRTIDVKRFLERSMKMVRAILPSHIQLECDFKKLGEEKLQLLGNETQLNQVMLNICVNGIHAIGSGEGRITIAASVIASSELQKRYENLELPPFEFSFVELDIHDTGCGMTEDVLEQIFDPFFTTKKNGQGTGLGLSLVEQIVTSHRGYIMAESHPGEGSCFHLYVPLLREGEEGELSEDAPVPVESEILIVGENRKVLNLLEKNFQRIGKKICTCAELKEAEALLKQGRIRVLIMDYYISGVNAIDFFMTTQLHYPDLLRILVADSPRREILEAAQRGIIDAWLEKPLSVPAILDTLLSAGKSVSAAGMQRERQLQ